MEPIVLYVHTKDFRHAWMGDTEVRFTSIFGDVSIWSPKLNALKEEDFGTFVTIPTGLNASGTNTYPEVTKKPKHFRVTVEETVLFYCNACKSYFYEIPLRSHESLRRCTDCDSVETEKYNGA